MASESSTTTATAQTPTTRQNQPLNPTASSAATTTMSSSTILDRYMAAFLLGACGDAMGYKRGRWEFNRSGPHIHAEMMELTGDLGVNALLIKLPQFNLSDDTVMQIATAEGFLEDATALPESVRPVSETTTATQPARAASPAPITFDQRCTLIAQAYVRSFEDMYGRAPGSTTGCSIDFLERCGPQNWYKLPFSTGHGGCGAAMRSIPLGLVFPYANQLDLLIAYGVETGRMTHHAGMGYLGAVAGGLLTSFGLQQIPIVEWGKRLLDTRPMVEAYLKHRGISVEDNILSLNKFYLLWTAYLKERNILTGVGPVQFPSAYGPRERDDFYVKISINGWPGATGIDAPMVAYDALLSADHYCRSLSKGGPIDLGLLWSECCLRGMLHGGDSDSTGILIGGWYGALYGLQHVPKIHYQHLEYHDRMVKLVHGLYERYHESRHPPHSGDIRTVTLIQQQPQTRHNPFLHLEEKIDLTGSSSSSGEDEMDDEDEDEEKEHQSPVTQNQVMSEEHDSDSIDDPNLLHPTPLSAAQ